MKIDRPECRQALIDTVSKCDNCGFKPKSINYFYEEIILDQSKSDKNEFKTRLHKEEIFRDLWFAVKGEDEIHRHPMKYFHLFDIEEKFIEL